MTPKTHDLLKELERINNSNMDSTILRKIVLAYGIKNANNLNILESTPQGRRSIEIRTDSIVNQTFDAVIRQKNQLSILTIQQKKEYYENYIEFGAKLLQEDYADGKLGKNFIFNIVQREVTIPIDKRENNYTRKKEISPIIVDLGLDNDSQNVKIVFNDNKNNGYHMGIVGTTGSGKTQLGLNIGTQILNQSKHTNLIFFDYAKGDVASNNKFVKDINATVIDAAKDGIPFNPFDIKEINDSKIEELKEIIVSNQARIGPNQKLELFEVLKQTYNKYETPDFNQVFEELKEFYGSQNKGYNVVVELFHKISIPNIFRRIEGRNHITSFLETNLIIDLHNIESTMSIKELVAFFILHKAYTEAIRLPDSQIDSETGMREIRSIIMIDEGHNYLSAKNPVLEKMLRELRSKGIAVIIMTQGYLDFKTKAFDYSEMMNWIVIMKSQIESRYVQTALNVSNDMAKDLQISISKLSPLSFYMRGLRSADNYPTRISSVPYN